TDAPNGVGHCIGICQWHAKLERHHAERQSCSRLIRCVIGIKWPHALLPSWLGVCCSVSEQIQNGRNLSRIERGILLGPIVQSADRTMLLILAHGGDDQDRHYPQLTVRHARLLSPWWQRSCALRRAGARSRSRR